MQVLALVPGGVSDQILFFPTFDDLKRSYPHAQIDVVVEPRAKSAYRVCKSVRNVIPFDFQANNSLADWGNLLGVIRDREYDISFALGQRWSTGLLLWLTGIPVRIGYGNGTSNWFLSHSIPFKADQYLAQTYHDLLQGLEITTPCPDLALNVPKKDIEWAEAEQKRLNIKDSGYVLVYGGIDQPTQTQAPDPRYPISHWQTIIQDFQKRQPELPIVVIQDAQDREWVAQLLEACPALKITAPDEVGQMAAMIAAANLLICPESTPMHLAVAVQTYTIALFGANDPTQLLPARDRFISVKSSTGNLADLSPQTVLTRIWGK